MHLLHVARRTGDTYLAKALTQAGHVVDRATDIGEALLATPPAPYDAVLVEAVDLADLPVARLARSAQGGVLVLVVDHAEPEARTRALRTGADACFIRPVHFRELEARISALARLTPRRTSEGPFILDTAARTARLAGQALVLPAQEFRLLEYMTRHAGEVVSARQILDQVWGEHGDPKPELVRTTIARLRGKLADAFGQPFLMTVRGHGYRLDAT